MGIVLQKEEGMRMFTIVCLVLVCAAGFSEERVVPTAGSFGFVGVLQTLTDSDAVTPGTNLSVNRRMGIGFHYHIFRSFMLEWLTDLSYDSFRGDGDSLQVGAALSAFYWLNLDDAFSIYFGPQISSYNNNVLDTSNSISHVEAAALFGLQYSFSKHFAVFGDFGLGFYVISDLTGASWKEYRYFKVVLPEIGFVFYL
jgi:hypothetical protein